MSENPLPPTIDIDAQLKAQNEFEAAFGRAMLQWAELENVLGLWFCVATGMSEHMGRAIFYSTTSFRPKLDLLYAAIDATDNLADTKHFLKSVLSKSRKYSTFRNAMAHGHVHYNMIQETATYRQFVLSDGAIKSAEDLDGGITYSKLIIAISNITDLATLSLDILPGPRQSRPEISPEEHRLRVHRLPTEAWSDQPNLNHLPQPPRAPSVRT
ncbi:hypothetical protein [Methylobacterium sp. 37f]|uniref:hypothetical protein n=1 Tax=Methylobacterium sp. 37f TaxID=2817058 RepID=UPI001FFC7D15|nr:hypothetical protein [Methylobacterium sp. 37f]MCK2057122.1 hypothetical protein [Methylobacterium sp. 37f]